MSTCQERVISRPQEGGGLDSMAPGGLFQLCDSDSEYEWRQVVRCKIQACHQKPFLLHLAFLASLRSY